MSQRREIHKSCAAASVLVKYNGWRRAAKYFLEAGVLVGCQSIDYLTGIIINVVCNGQHRQGLILIATAVVLTPSDVTTQHLLRSNRKIGASADGDDDANIDESENK